MGKPKILMKENLRVLVTILTKFHYHMLTMLLYHNIYHS